MEASQQALPNILFVGLPCSGKTTAGDLLHRLYGYDHREASQFMRLHYQSASRNCSVAEFAAHVLRTDPTYVPRAILRARALEGTAVSPLALSGLRSPNEIDYVLQNLQALNKTLVIALDAPANLRFLRCKSRARIGDPSSFATFLSSDQEQLDMGLSALLALPNIIHLQNVGAMEDFTAQLSSRLLNRAQGT